MNIIISSHKMMFKYDRPWITEALIAGRIDNDRRFRLDI